MTRPLSVSPADRVPPVARPALVVLGLGASLFLVACGGEPLVAAFTSRVVQREVCRVVGDRPEVCTRDEAITDVRVRLVERDDGNVWLYGIHRGGGADRAILGTRDSDDGFLFVDETVQENDLSACVLTRRLEISVVVDPAADPAQVGDSVCVALLGRETEVTTSSAGCDTVNDPKLTTTTIARRRWEAPPECAP